VEWKRRQMVAAVRSGRSQRAVARQFHVALRTVQNWLRRAGSETLEAVDWSSHRRTPRLRPKQTDPALERRVCLLRKELERESALGFVGAQAIHDALCAEQPRASLPSVRTLNRILRRNGLLDGKARVRRPAPSDIASPHPKANDLVPFKRLEAPTTRSVDAK